MNRRERLYGICAPLAESAAAAENYTDHLEELFDVLVPARIGPAFERALAENDYAAAVHACAAYYRQKPACPASDLTAKGGYNLQDAEDYLAGRVCTVSVKWEFPEGEIDFLFNPTLQQGPVNHEWLWQFNRHNEWPNLARTYCATKDERYARFFDGLMRKWVAQATCPDPWNAAGRAWRTLECGLRLQGPWQVAFDGFRASPSF